MRILKASTESFDALLDFLEEHGNPVLGRRWRVDKEGLHSYMGKPLDLALIRAHFEIHDDVELNDHYNFISTRQEWMDIHHRMPPI
jgi:hypothetical protein